MYHLFEYVIYNCDFTAMDALDGDGQTLTSRGRMALRDIVQVPVYTIGVTIS